jgi:hypothetical protein
MDQYAFVGVSLILVAGLAARRRRKILGGLRHQGPVVALVPADTGIEVGVWRHMLETLARSDGVGRSARKFLCWHSRRLAVLPASRVLDSKTVLSAWQPHLANFARVWLVALWPLLLWAVLILGPLHTNVMEKMAKLTNHQRNRIFDVLIEAKDRNGRVVRESLQVSANGKGLFRNDTAFLSSGNIIVRATDFPRVYRRFAAICAGVHPSCAVSEDDRSDSTFALEGFLRGGRAEFRFRQTDANPQLNLKLWLTQRNDSIFDEITIEPKD